jgi:hypothetical protein
MGPNSTVQDCCIHEWIDHQTQNMTHHYYPSHTQGDWLGEPGSLVRLVCWLEHFKPKTNTFEILYK